MLYTDLSDAVELNVPQGSTGITSEHRQVRGRGFVILAVCVEEKGKIEELSDEKSQCSLRGHTSNSSCYESIGFRIYPVNTYAIFIVLF